MKTTGLWLIVLLTMLFPRTVRAEMDFDTRVFRPPAPAGPPVRVDAPPAVRQGQVSLVTIHDPAPGGEVSAWYGKKPISLIEGDRSMIGLLPADVLASPGPRTLRIAWTDGQGLHRRDFLVPVETKDYGSRSINVDSAIFSMGPGGKKKAQEDERLIAAALARKTPERYWRGPFSRPAAGRTTSGFGVRTRVNGKWRDFPHEGLDYRGAVGDPVRATADGVVALTSDYYYTGNAIYLDHGEGLISCYFHLSRIQVKEGDWVKKGQVIGRIGSTGVSTASHLHYGLHLDGAWIDPGAFHRLVETLESGKASAGMEPVGKEEATGGLMPGKDR
jgi:murein DD-endopeptidase MepM/ murein hydrolase activator NlpD